MQRKRGLSRPKPLTKERNNMEKEREEKEDEVEKKKREEKKEELRLSFASFRISSICIFRINEVL